MGRANRQRLGAAKAVSTDATAESMATSEPDTRINAAATAAAKTFMLNLIGVSRVLGVPRLLVADFQLLIYIN